MGEETTEEIGRFGSRRSRFLAGGTTGFVAAVALLMVLSPAAGATHPNSVLKAPYKGSVSSPNYGTNIYGCATAKTTVPKWSATTGIATGMGAATAKPCPKALGYTGTYSDGFANGGIGVAVPFLVSTSGSHSIGIMMTVTMAPSVTFTTPACPAKKVNYHPSIGASSGGSCSVGSFVELYVSASVQDLANSSWYGNYSYAIALHSTGWENYTYCYNYGTATCYNHTGSYSSNYSYGYGVSGLSPVNWSGATTFTMWGNGTKMVTGHHYVVDFQVSTTFLASAGASNLAGPWLGSASGSLNWGTLGNGAKLDSITIV